jgi:RHS repeat-associated protein
LLSVKVANSNGIGYAYQENYSYDGLTRVSAVTYTIDSRTYTTDYAYNQVGQRNRIGHIYFHFDNEGHIFGVRNYPVGGNGISYLTNATYDLTGRLISDSLSTNGGYVNETFGRDAQRLQLTTQTATKGATSLMNLTYSYQASTGQMGAGTTAGNANQLMNVTGTINNTTESSGFTYGLQGQLITSNQTTNSSSAQRRFNYDPYGNRTAVYDAVSGGNQIQSIALSQSGGAPTNRIASVTSGGSAVNYTYDANGNITNDGVHSYTLDAVNRVVSVDGGTTAQYGYDHQNRRIKKVTGATTRHYVWDGEQVLAEYNGATGGLLVQYFYAHGRLVAKVEGGVTNFFLSDRLSTRLVLDINGNVVGRQAHLPFGEPWATSGTPDKHLLTSYESDPESGQQYAINRGYSQNVGRFNQADPFAPSASEAVPQSWNRYTYVLNDPVNYIDPLGLSVAGPRGPSETDPCNSCYGREGCVEFPEPPPPQKKPERLYAGFNDRDLEWIETAKQNAVNLILGFVDKNIDNDCMTNLSSRVFSGGRRINVFDLVHTIIGLRAKSERDDESTWGPFDIINGRKSKAREIEEARRRNPGAGAYIDNDGRGIVLLNGFFGGFPGRPIGFAMSAGILLLHEAIHLQGISDLDFDTNRDTGSRKLTTFIIQSCLNKNLTYLDLSTTIR